jgi:hypothetical protein
MHLPIGEHLSSFPFLAIPNKVVMNIWIQDFMQKHLIYLGRHLVGWLCHKARVTFIKNYSTFVK